MKLVKLKRGFNFWKVKFLESFRKDLYKKFYDKLIDEKLLDKEKSETLMHPLYDISEIIEKVYQKLIPNFFFK